MRLTLPGYVSPSEEIRVSDRLPPPGGAEAEAGGMGVCPAWRGGYEFPPFVAESESEEPEPEIPIEFERDD